MTSIPPPSGLLTTNVSTFLLRDLLLCPADRQQVPSESWWVAAGLRVATYRNLSIFETDGIYENCLEMQVNLTVRNNIINHCNSMSLIGGYCGGTEYWGTENNRYKNKISAAEC